MFIRHSPLFFIVLVALLLNAVVTAVPIYPPRQLHPSSHRSGFIISEIMYHPSERLDGVDLEFVELYNTEPVDMDISGFSLAGEIEYTFPTETIFPARSFIVVAADPAALESEYSLSGVYGPFTGSLDNAGGNLQLINNRGAVILDIDYNDTWPWPETADGAGNSLVLMKPDFGENNPASWAASTFRGGNPGTTNSPAVYNICFNEILANPAVGQVAFFELYNRGSQTINLQGYYLTDDPTILKYQVPGTRNITPGGVASFSTSDWGTVMSLEPTGGKLYLISPDEQHTVAAARYRTENEGVSLGRYPDGTRELTALASPTAGSKNSGLLDRGIIINEIMYHHISGDSSDEYIELYNRGTQTIDVSGWRLSAAIDFIIPSNTVINAGEYLVIAGDADKLIARYPALTAANTAGDYDGTLNNRGERIRLSMPAPGAETNGMYITVNEVTYADGGDWGYWTDGEGSSLELKDPFSDNRFSGSWAGSDETAKSSWTTVQHTDVLDNGGSDADTIELMLMDPGECLVDDISVVKSGETANRVANGDFESGTSGWTIQGNHIDSSVVDNEGVGNSRAMHIKASGSGNNSVNRLKKPLTANLYNGETATVSYKARWLCGSRLLLAKLHGNYLEAISPLAIPGTLGSPGEQNSVFASSSGPVIEDGTHFPVLPDASEKVVVSAFITDPDGIDSAILYYRVDPASSYSQVTMNDSGFMGDRIPNDNVYSSEIPGQADDTLVAFYIEATDNGTTPASTRYPAAAPEKECLVRFGDTAPDGIYSSYKIWMTADQVSQWRADQKLSNRLQPGTFIYGTFRAVYGAAIRMRGSTWVRYRYSDPINYICNYLVKVPRADRIQGTRTITLDALEQQDVWSGGVRDTTYMREKMTFWMGEYIGIPTLYMRNIHMYINGKKQGLIYAETQQVNGDYVESWFPYNTGGHMYEISHWHEYNDATQVDREWTTQATLENHTTTGGVKKKARYRWNWKKERGGAADDDYEPLFELVDAVNVLNDYYDTVDPLVDWNEWMRAFAVRQAVCDWDGYGRQNGQNGYMYKHAGNKWNFILFDADTGLGVQGHGPTENLFLISDPVLSSKFFQDPILLRAYWRALKDIVNGPFLSTEFNMTIDAHYQAFHDNGVNVGSTSTVKSWVNDRRNYIIGQLNALNTSFEITSNNGNDYSVADPSVTLNGTAPVEVDTIKVNGFAYPVTWTDVTTWQVSIGLYPEANLLEFQGHDSAGSEMGSMYDSITITYTGTESNAAILVINEIMYHPPGNNEEFLELYNASPLYPARMSDYTLLGIDATFASNIFLGPETYGVIVENRTEFMNMYGAGITILGEYTGKLDNGGEQVTLLKIDQGSGQGTVVDNVIYEDSWPWPDAADGTGPSLQLVSPSAENSRPANWGIDLDSLSTPGRQNSISMPSPFAEVWINELQSVNTTGIVDNAGDRDPWLELYIASGSDVLASNITVVPAGSVWKYKDDGSDQGTAWRDPGFDDSGWASGPAELGYGDGGEATVVSFGADSQNKYPTTYFRHYFIVPDASAYSTCVLGLRRDDGGVVYVNGTEVRRDNMTGTVQYQTYASATVYGDEETSYYESAVDSAFLVDGTNVLAVEIHQVSGDSSDISFDLYLKATIEYQDTDFSGYYLSDTPTNPAQWAFPSDTPVSSGMFMVVWADGEPAESENGSLHTDFRLNTSTGSLYLSRITGIVTQVLDYITYPSLAADVSFGSIPDGEAYNRVIMSIPTPGASNMSSTRVIPVVINEWMSANTTTIADPADGTYADWFELYNPTTQAVDISGCVLSDGTDDWTVPGNVSVPAEGFLLIWADDEPEQNNGTNGLHAGFKLSRDGENIELSYEGSAIDRIVYGAQNDDISHGRWPDGSSEILMMFPPTPGEPNEIPEPVAGGIFFIIGWLIICRRKAVPV